MSMTTDEDCGPVSQRVIGSPSLMNFNSPSLTLARTVAILSGVALVGDFIGASSGDRRNNVRRSSLQTISARGYAATKRPQSPLGSAFASTTTFGAPCDAS